MLTQSHYRFGVVEGTEATHGWYAAEDFGVMLPPGRPFLCRVNVQNDATASAPNTVMQWQCRLTPKATGVPGAWANVTTASAVVRTGSPPGMTFGAGNCTKRLSGTGTFESSGAGCTITGTAGGNANDIAASGCSETEIPLQIIGADTAVGDVVELRVVGASGVAYGAYTAVPSVLVGANVLTVAARNPGLNYSDSVGVNKISGALVRGQCVGMSAADLADATLSIAMNVWGTTVAGSTDPADYTVLLQGPVGWSGGQTGKPGTELAGMAIPPNFTFAEDIPEGVRRVLATFDPSRACTFGADATIVEAA